MGVIVQKAGLYTTIQDIGRVGKQKSGFHVSGVMDRTSYYLANLLLDNGNDVACLEFSIIGPTVKFTTDAVIAITGGYFKPKLNGHEVRMYCAICVHAGDILEFSFSSDGVWGYLSVAGGFDVPLALGSRSTDIASKLGGFDGRKLVDNDEIGFCKHISYLPNFERRTLPVPKFASDLTELHVVMGPQEDYFSKAGIDTFLNTRYTVTDKCDRMGYRLGGNEIEHNEKGADIISDGIAYGAIQVPSEGLPIVMLSDRQTTGGYTKIATVASVDIPKLVQCRPQSQIKFTAVSVDVAQYMYLEQWKEFDRLKGIIQSETQERKKKSFIAHLLDWFK